MTASVAEACAAFISERERHVCLSVWMCVNLMGMVGGGGGGGVCVVSIAYQCRSTLSTPIPKTSLAGFLFACHSQTQCPMVCANFVAVMTTHLCVSLRQSVCVCVCICASVCYQSANNVLQSSRMRICLSLCVCVCMCVCSCSV